MTPAKKKKAARRKGARKPLAVAIFLALFVILTLAAAFFFIFLGPQNPLRQTGLPHLSYEQSPAISQFPLPPVKKRALLTPSPTLAPATAEAKYNIAIVIDDMGYQKKLGRQFLALDFPLSFSFLPHAPFTKLLAGEAQRKKRDILLHVPLEPHDPTWDLGPGALMVSMADGEIAGIFSEDLAFVPMAIGVNNHMGSKFTEDRKAMTALLLQLKKHRLFFLDSLTSSRSIGYELAEEIRIGAARRNVFLDNLEETGAILGQLDSLTDLARRHGNAIGIAHPKEATLKTLRQFSTEIPPDIRLVEIHQVVQ